MFVMKNGNDVPLDVVQKLDRFGSERWRDLADIAVDEEQKSM